MKKGTCNICKKVAESAGKTGLISLVNGEFIHDSCYEDVIQKLNNKQYSIRAINQEILSLDGFFKRLFGGPDRESKKHELQQIISSTEKEISNENKRLTKLYDYWPDYPPDWKSRRRSKLESDSYEVCEVCGSYGELHIHHIKEVSKGGSHLLDNLAILCKDCHTKEHPWMSDSSSGRKRRKPPFRAKLDLINDALATKKKIRFSYTNQNKEKSTRTIQPSNFVRPGEQYTDGSGIVRNLCIGGHCQLRKASRVFNISKMEDIKRV